MILFAALVRLRSDESLRVLRRAYGSDRQRLEVGPILRAAAQIRYGIVCREIERRSRLSRDFRWPWCGPRPWS